MGNDLFKCLMIYHNTPLTSSMKSLMQILQSRITRSDLPMSNAARKQFVLDFTLVNMNICLHMTYTLVKM